MIVVLGGGPAGRTAALTLALGGREVILVEKNGIGGQCLHYGCMMVCALNEAARALTQARRLCELGIIDTVPGIRFPTLLSEMKAIQDKIAGILDAETRGSGVTILYGKEGSIEVPQFFWTGRRSQRMQLLPQQDPVLSSRMSRVSGQRGSIPLTASAR